ncbi:hypothetical protein JQ625_29645 [Bradyrhizobium diazoefficiens]|nr:hypothetical protein [Bradyrhizobium diazoefficiens]MBR0779008.1 hypothetical protein [Bradyrhizobium diazoefficiens]
MWARSVAKSNGDGSRWLLGLFRLYDPLVAVPERTWVIQGIQGWTDLDYGAGSGIKIAVIPEGWAFGWTSPVKETKAVFGGAENITISCGPAGCPTTSHTGNIILTITADKPE